MKVKIKKSDTDLGDYDSLLTAVDAVMESLEPGKSKTENLEIEFINDDEPDDEDNTESTEEESNNG